MKQSNKIKTMSAKSPKGHLGGSESIVLGQSPSSKLKSFGGKKIKIALLLSFVISELFAFGILPVYAQGAPYTQTKCYGNVCAQIDAPNLLADSGVVTGVDPNTNVNLIFSILVKNGTNFSDLKCPRSTQQLYHAVRQDLYTVGSTNGRSSLGHKFPASSLGAGDNVQFNFNSSVSNTQNVYYGIFYCWNKQVTASDLDAVISNATANGEAWNTPILDVATRQGQGTPVINQSGQGTPNLGNQTGQGTPVINNGSCTDPNKCLYNPLPLDELTATFLVIIQGFLGIVAIWAVIFIIVGGFQMVMAAGNEETYLKAKKTITWAVLGLVIALLSFSIVAVVENILQTKIQPTTSTTQH